MKALLAILLSLSLGAPAWAGYDEDDRKQQYQPPRKQQQEQEVWPPQIDDPRKQQQDEWGREPAPIFETEIQVIARRPFRIGPQQSLIPFESAKELYLMAPALHGPGMIWGGCDVSVNPFPRDRWIRPGTPFRMLVSRIVEPRPRTLDDILQIIAQTIGLRADVRNVQDGIAYYRHMTGITLSDRGAKKFLLDLHSRESGARLSLECNLMGRDQMQVEYSQYLSFDNLLMTMSKTQNFLFDVNPEF